MRQASAILLILLVCGGCRSLGDAFFESLLANAPYRLDGRARSTDEPGISRSERQARFEEEAQRNLDFREARHHWRQQGELQKSLQETNQSWFRFE